MSTTAHLRGWRRRAALIGLAGLAAFSVPGATASPAAAAPPTITDADVTLAGLGVLTFVATNATADPVTAPCPMMTQDELGWFMGQQNYAPNFNGFFVDVYYESDLGSGYPGIDCGVDIGPAVDAPDPAAPHYPILGAAYLAEDVTFEQYLTQVEQQTILNPAVAGIGGEIGGRCVERSPGFCFLHWHRGGLVISIVLAGGTGDITRAKTEAMLIAMVPTAVAGLRGGTTAATPSTAAEAPTVAVTTAPITAAPATAPITAAPATAPITAAPATVPPLPTAPASVAPVATTVPVPTVATAPVTIAPGPTTTAAGATVTLPPGFVLVTDSSRRLSVAVPDTWTVDGAPQVADDGTEVPHIVASTNIPTYLETFDVAGVEVFLIPFQADTAAAITQFGLTSGCTTTVTEPYRDPVFTGHIGHWTNCGGGTAEWHLVVASPADQSVSVAVIVQITGPQEQQILDTVLATFDLLPGGQSPAPAATAASPTTASAAGAATATTLSAGASTTLAGTGSALGFQDACSLVPDAEAATATGLSLDGGTPAGDERRRVCTFQAANGVGVTIGVEAGGRFDEKADVSRQSLGDEGEVIPGVGDRALFFYSAADLPEGVGGVLVALGDLTIDVTMQGLDEATLRRAGVALAELAVSNL